METPLQPQVIIETGHRYVLEDLHNPGLIQKEIALAESVGRHLSEKGFENNKIILLDEVKPEENAEASTEDSWRWRLFIERDKRDITEVVPDDYTVWSESEYKDQAFRVIDDIRQKIKENPKNILGVRLAGEAEDKIKIGSNKKGQNISLLRSFKTQSGEITLIPSCSLLDLCVYQAKLQQAEIAVTLLPVDFKEQQTEVRLLFSILEQSPNVIVLYFDPESFAITDVESWNDDYVELAQEIKSQSATPKQI